MTQLVMGMLDLFVSLGNRHLSILFVFTFVIPKILVVLSAIFFFGSLRLYLILTGLKCIMLRSRIDFFQ